MAQINFNDFLATQNNNQNAAKGEGKGSGVGFFSLKNDKDFAIVRIMHDSTDDFDIVAGHRMTVNDKLRMVNCIRSAHEPVENCPLCSAGKNLEYRLYIHLIEYVKNDEGKIIPIPRVWERSASYVNTLTNLIQEYGPLSENIFKITRNGEKGSKSTTYDIMYGSPKVYSNELYPMRPDAFKNYKAVGNMVLDYQYDKLAELVGGSPAANEATPKYESAVAYNTTPTYTQAPAPAVPAYNASVAYNNVPVNNPTYAEAQAQMAEVPAPPVYAQPAPTAPAYNVPNTGDGFTRPRRTY